MAAMSPASWRKSERVGRPRLRAGGRDPCPAHLPGRAVQRPRRRARLLHRERHRRRQHEPGRRRTLEDRRGTPDQGQGDGRGLDHRHRQLAGPVQFPASTVQPSRWPRSERRRVPVRSFHATQMLQGSRTTGLLPGEVLLLRPGARCLRARRGDRVVAAAGRLRGMGRHLDGDAARHRHGRARAGHHPDSRGRSRRATPTGSSGCSRSSRDRRRRCRSRTATRVGVGMPNVARALGLQAARLFGRASTAPGRRSGDRHAAAPDRGAGSRRRPAPRRSPRVVRHTAVRPDVVRPAIVRLRHAAAAANLDNAREMLRRAGLI